MFAFSSNRWTAPLCAALFVALVHAVSLAFWFHSDDFFILLGVRDHGLFGIWSGHESMFFRPLTSMSHWLDLHMFGLNPVGHHLVNVLLAMISAALVVVLARRLAPSAPGWITGLAGCLFALMPAHAEAVDWISCRGDLLCTDFALAAAIVALRGGRGAVAGAAVLAMLAFASKESALGLPLFLGTIVLLTRNRKLLPATLATLGVAVAMVVIRGLTLGHAVGGYRSPLSLPRVVTNAPLFLTSTLSPASVQTLRHSPLGSLAPILGAITIYHKAVAVALLLLAVLLLRTKLRLDSAANRMLWATLAGFFALALPVLFQGGVYGFTWESTRYLYLPSVSLAIFLALSLSRMPRSVALGAGGTLALLYAVGDVPAVGAWWVAGEQTHRAIDALLARSGRVVALAAPDSYRGAFVLRNGTNEALELLSPGRHANVLLLALYVSETPQDWPRISDRGVVPAPGALPFETLGPSSHVSKEFGMTVVSLTSTNVQAELGPGVQRMVIFPDRLQPMP